MGASSGSTAVGYQAAYSGGEQAVTAFGYQAGYSQAGANPGSNTWIGYQSGFWVTSGGANTALGYQAFAQVGTSTTGSYNTALGMQSLQANTTGSYNNALGYQAGYSTTTGTSNTYIGTQCGYFITTGSKNTILGGYTGNAGGLDIRTASNYIVLSDGDGNPRLYIDNGPTLVCPAVYSVTSANAANMVVLSNGSIARSTSALKYKQDIRDIEEVDINLLRGVRYKSKSEQDDQTKDHFGIVADEVDAAGIKELVTYGADGEVEGFQYERLTVVLLKAIQTLKAEVDSLKAQLNGASA
jgi:hypothetical protein